MIQFCLLPVKMTNSGFSNSLSLGSVETVSAKHFTFSSKVGMIDEKDVIAMKRWIYICLIVVFSLTFVVSAFFLTRYFLQSRDQQAQFDRLAGLVAQQTVPGRDDPSAAGSSYDAYVQITHPVTGEQIRILRQYAQLFLENPHMAGWMHIPG